MLEFVRRKKGSATIETAVMIILIMMLAVGFIYLSQAVTVASVVQTAAREGAREYSLTDNKAKAVNKAIIELKMGGIDSSNANIAAKAEAQERRVAVTVNYPLAVPFVGKREITLKGGAVFRVAKNLR